MKEMRTNMSRLISITAICLTMVLGRASLCMAQSPAEVGIDERLGAVLPLNTLQFRDEDGRAITLGSLFDRPVVLTLVYFRCPGICTPLLNELARAMGECNLQPGKDYRAITISFDPTETPDLAKRKKTNMIAEVKGKEVPPDAWRFLTGDADNIRRITDAVGFRYTKDRNQVDYVHGATVVFVSAEGKIVRYLNGVQVSPVEMKMALLDAAAGRSQSFMERQSFMGQVKGFCFASDPQGRGYVLRINNIILLATLLLTAAFVAFLVVKGRARRLSDVPQTGGDA
jgi:protein SCO1